MTVGRLTVRAAGALAAAGALLAGSLPGADPARAATGRPPVTAPDSVIVYTGDSTMALVVLNDSDADGDDLTVCRLGDVPRGLEVGPATPGSPVLLVEALRGARPGTYPVTYYACDFSSLVPGTLSVVVRSLPEPKVRKVEDRPGRLRVTNRADVAMTFAHGAASADEADGTVRVGAGDSVVVRVRRTTITWTAFAPRLRQSMGEGKITGIELPRTAR